MSEAETILDYDIHIPCTLISIIGKMGSGKTNWGYHLLEEVRAEARKRMKRVASIYFQFDWGLVSEFFDAVRAIRKRSWAYVFIDDVSFALEARERKSREFLSQLAQIRHLNPRIKRWFIAVASHYSKATVPFLRQAQVIIFTSLTTWEEIKGAMSYFPRSAVKKFYREYLSNPASYPALVNCWGRVALYTIPYYPHKYWGYTVKANGVKVRE